MTDGMDRGHLTRTIAERHMKTSKNNTEEKLMSDEMLNKTKAYNKSSGQQGIGDTIDAMEEYDMNKLNDSVGPNQSGKLKPSSISKNS